MPAVHLQLVKNANTIKAALPFSNVLVIDARFDTLCVGFTKGTMSSKHRIIFETTASNEIKNYITKNYVLRPEGDSSYRLVILLEKFWVSSSIETGKEDGPGMQTISRGFIIKANLLAEVNGLYHPLYRIDSAFLTNLDTDGNNVYTIVERSIDKMLDKIVDKKASELKISRKSLTDNDINNYISQKLSLPILTCTSYNKGVYNTFDEFKNNNPSTTDFEVGKNSKTDALYVKDGAGGSYLLKNFWGYSDGKKIYINSGNNFFQLIREGNTFNIYGFKSFKKSSRPNIAGTILEDVLIFPGIGEMSTASYSSKRNPLQVDMETGELF